MPTRKNKRIYLLLEGDSWMDLDIAGPALWDMLNSIRVNGRRRYRAKTIAHYGHTLQGMARDAQQRRQFADMVQRFVNSGVTPAAILLCGGGNDFRKRLPSLLKHSYPPEGSILDEIQVKKFLDKEIHEPYQEWLRSISDTCMEAFQDLIPILIHGYAHPVPDGRSIVGSRSTMLRDFHAKGHLDLARNTRTMAGLIDRLNDTLLALIAQPDLQHVRHVDLRPTLSNDLTEDRGMPHYQRHWRDELHPKRKGFMEIAETLAMAVETVI